jgi:hypothetical protein
VAERLERVRRELEAREREMLVANERRAHSELRIQQLVRDRVEQEGRRKALTADSARLREERARHAGALEHLRERAEARAAENSALRSMLQSERASGEAEGRRARELARELAAAEGARQAAERRGREAEERAAALREQRDGVEG